MSLIPFILDLDDTFARPSRLLDQQFGLGLSPRDMDLIPAWPRRCLGRYIRPWGDALSRLDSASTVTADKDKFQVSLDVQHFSPNEISVKTSDNFITVEGKHEEKKDEHGYISRQFVRRYALPEGHDAKEVVSSLSSDGVLTITAPRQVQGLKESERIVPITATGPVQRTIESKAAEKEAEMQQ